MSLNRGFSKGSFEYTLQASSKHSSYCVINDSLWTENKTIHAIGGDSVVCVTESETQIPAPTASLHSGGWSGRGPNGPADGDGSTNFEERISGTDPNRSNTDDDGVIDPENESVMNVLTAATTASMRTVRPYPMKKAAGFGWFLPCLRFLW